MDPAVIATLAGPALGAIVQFICSRVDGALGREPAVVSEGEAKFVEEYPGPLPLDESALTSDREARLQQLAGTLAVYRDHPEIARGDDSRLVESIVLACMDLSALYGIKFRFQNSEAGEVRVDQQLGDVERPVTGIKASGIRRGVNVDLKQTAVRVSRDGRIVGLEVDGFIG
ncbi:hypothetical protein [Micromonospora sp. NPDC023814]|uniref:hypothetical protein n=1 Tax=Micromonospora sp. NPDC023814 TaxID=3154596 RepID=UPI003408DB9E